MSKLFFDHLVSLEEIEREIDKVATTEEEKAELWALVDEIIHHKVMDCILENLPQGYHEEFLLKVHERPFDETLFDYLKEKIGRNMEEIIKQQTGNLAFEILKEIQLQTEK